MEFDTLKKSFPHLLPAGMSPMGLGRYITWFSPEHQVVGVGRGRALPLCSQAACCQEPGPTGKGPLGFFFSCLLSWVKSFILKVKKQQCSGSFLSSQALGRQHLLTCLGERAEERNSLGRKVKLVQPPAGSKGTHPWMHCFQ